MIRYLVLGILFSVLPLILSAQAGLRVIPMVGYSQYQPIGGLVGPGQVMTPLKKLSYGISLGIPINMGLDLEIGYILKTRSIQFTSSSPSTDLVVNSEVKEIPIYLRIYLSKMFQLGVGAYYVMLPSSATVTGSIAGAAVNQTNTSDANDPTKDYGVSASLRMLIPVGRLIHLFVDGRYNYGMVNTSGDPAENVITRDIAGYSGILLNL